MKIFDPHVDVADMYAYLDWSIDDFYSGTKAPWVTRDKLRQAGIDVIGLTLYFDKSLVKTNFFDGVNNFYDFYQDLINKEPESYQQILTASDLSAKKSGQLGYFFSIEGFECFRTPQDFHYFYQKGIRCFGFTWSFENQYAHGRNSSQDEGITRKGKEVIQLMNQTSKLIVDIAHLSEVSVKDLDRLFEGMIVSTHTNLRSIKDAPHNLTDAEVQLIIDRGGVVSLFPLTEDTGPNGTFDDLYAHVDYFLSKWGDDHLAFSSDIYPLAEYPFLHHYDDILIDKLWADYLLKRLPLKTVTKIMYSNWQRVINSAL